MKKTNPTFISKQIKLWVMEQIPNFYLPQYDDRFSGIKNIIMLKECIILGLERGMHEYSKKRGEDKRALNMLQKIINGLKVVENETSHNNSALESNSDSVGTNEPNVKEGKNKQTIRLNESQSHKIIKESVKEERLRQIIRESINKVLGCKY